MLFLLLLLRLLLRWQACLVCPLRGSGDLTCDGVLDGADAALGSMLVSMSSTAGQMSMEAPPQLQALPVGCSALEVMDGNQDGSVDLMDISGWYSLAFRDGGCPKGFFQLDAPWIAEVCAQ